MPPLPPAPPLPPLSALLQAAAGGESHWVLFIGSDVILHGDASDEADAKKARQSLSGDLVWFRFEGKTFVSQDKDVLDRIRGVQTDPTGRDLAREQERVLLDTLNAMQKVADANRSQDLEAVMRKLTELRKLNDNGIGPEQLTDLSQRIERARVDSLNAQRDQERRMLELERVVQELNLTKRQIRGARDLNILSDAVRSGKAQAAP
jgi:hypothetical protein